MKRRKQMAAVVLLLAIPLAWAAYQVMTSPAAPLNKFIPAGALLYLQAQDFSSLLADWNASPEKQAWLKSDNYQVFSRSRLFLRLQKAEKEFAVAAGIPPDMNFLSQVAGKESVFALYDIGNLEFVYISRKPGAAAVQSALYQSRSKFETRNAGGVPFYVRTDPESGRMVGFAVTNDYLVLGTREEALAEALELIAGKAGRSLEQESWWAQAVAAAAKPGDLRMVLNMEKIVPSPYFRSYWVQQNITEMKQYSAVVTDLFRASAQYREERVLLRGGGEHQQPDAASTQAVADLAKLVPEDASVFRVSAEPSAGSTLGLLTNKILTPQAGPAPLGNIAPQVQLTAGTTGSSSDLETRIDQEPQARITVARGTDALQKLLEEAKVRAVLQVQTATPDSSGVFVHTRSAVVMLAATDWAAEATRSAIAGVIRPGITTAQLGALWQQNKSGYFELDGLMPLQVAIRGKYLFVANDSNLMTTVLVSANRPVTAQPSVYLAGFNHARERNHFARLTRVVDRLQAQPQTSEPDQVREPEFFSENVASLSQTLSGVQSQGITVRDAGNKVLQTVTYTWSK